MIALDTAAQNASGLAVAALLAAGVGAVHTLLGPDHWLPFVAMARETRCSVRRLSGLVVLCGALHCIASIAIAALCVLGGLEFTELLALTEVRGTLAALALLALGVALFFPSRPRSGRKQPFSGRAMWWLMLVFVLGPCEWLVPAALAAAARFGAVGLVTISVAYSCATIATMLAATLSAVHVAGPLFRGATPRRVRWCAASALLVCAVLMLAGF